MMLGSSRRLTGSSCRYAWLCLFSTKTYYDSQSGLHISIHNEDEISVYANLSERSVDELPAILEATKKAGFAGAAMLPVSDNTLLEANAEALLASASAMPNDFSMFIPSQGVTDLPYPDNINFILEYVRDTNVLESKMSDHVKQGTPTTLVLTDTLHYEEDPIVVANGVAGLIDSTRGGNFVWIAPKEGGDSDSIVALCEELSYLDVAGPTMKSRLVVDLQSSSDDDEMLKELLTMGVNKFVFMFSDDENQEQWKWLESIVTGEGKRLARDS